MKIGYARASGEGQNLEQQIAALKAEGCDKVFSEILSSNRVVCPALEDALAELGTGDSLVVWRLDRLGRRTVDLIAFLQGLQSRGIYFQSLCEGLNSGTPLGKMFHGFIAALAENERDLTIERTLRSIEGSKAGQNRSQDRSQNRAKSGRSKELSQKDIEAAMILLSSSTKAGDKTADEPTLSSLAEALNTSKTTLSLRLKELKLDIV